jgi:hypothetical protein
MSIYTQATIRTAGVVTHEDKEDRGLEIQTWGNILVLSDGAEWWLSRNSFTAIPKAEAQTIYDAWIDAAIAAYVEDDYHDAGVKQIAERATLP